VVGALRLVVHDVGSAEGHAESVEKGAECRVVPLRRGWQRMSSSDRRLCVCFGAVDVVVEIRGRFDRSVRVVSVWKKLHACADWRAVAEHRVFRGKRPQLVRKLGVGERLLIAQVLVEVRKGRRGGGKPAPGNG
jgi:hypothetical protein